MRSVSQKYSLSKNHIIIRKERQRQKIITKYFKFRYAYYRKSWNNNKRKCDTKLSS